MASVAPAADYPWLSGRTPNRSLAQSFAPPLGFQRVDAKKSSYAAWLRGLPLLAADAKVLLYSGQEKAEQRIHVAVVDLDVGKQDLQQCADAIIRLRGEYFWATNPKGELAFRLASGKTAKWSGGNRAAFLAYLRQVFMFANTSSLRAQLPQPADPLALQAGDVLVQGPPRPGMLGHAVMVLDVATNAKGERLVLIGQSYTPAQSFEVLVNLGEKPLSPWYRAAALAAPTGLVTPQWWPFRAGDVRRFGGHP